MADEPVNSGDQRNAKGQFQRGNAGRQHGAVGRSTRLTRLLLSRSAGPLVRKCIEQALAGDMVAMRLCIERLCPVARHESDLKAVDLPAMGGARDLPAVTAALLMALLDGKIALPDILPILKLIEVTAESINTADHDRRLMAIERALEARRVGHGQ